MNGEPIDQAARATVVVGLGKIGLPLAAQIAGSGRSVIGCDLNAAVVDSVNAGISPVKEEVGLAQAIAGAVAAGKLRATRDTAAAVRAARTVIIIVPLTVDGLGEPDFAGLDAATRAVGEGLQPSTLVICETTVPVGTTRRRLGPILRERSRLEPGKDFFLAYSPERVSSGSVFVDLRRYPKIVGGVNVASAERVADFYRSILDAEVLQVSSAETAEFTKLAETTYRDVNIALANQLAVYARSRGVNAGEAFRAANTQPFSHLHTPGVGVGGHCIPVYPRFLLTDAAASELELLRVARHTNDGMPELAVGDLEDALGGLAGRRILVMGLAYRGNVKEMAFSSALPLIERLRASGSHVLVNDPLFRPDEVAHLGATSVELDGGLSVDGIVLQAFHDQYNRVDWRRFQGLKVVFDGRAALDPEVFKDLGVEYRSAGFRSLEGARKDDK